MNSVEFIKKELIGFLYLNSPKTKNALKPEDMGLIRDILNKEAKSDIYALINSGRGDVFCSGADFSEIISIFETAILKSQAQAISTPPPYALPFKAHTVGRGKL